MAQKTEPWYVHAILYVIIVVLAILLVKVAIIDPQKIVATEKYNKTESRLRMKNLKEAEILYDKRHGRFTGNLDTLIHFLKTDSIVDSAMNAYDSLAKRNVNPFYKLSNGEYTWDSLYRTPGSHKEYILQIDSTVQRDTVVNQRGKILRVDSTITKGTLYYIEDPDGYGTVGSTEDIAKKNTVSWE